MKLINTVGDFFALDIGTSAIRLVQLSKKGNSDSWTLEKYGYAPVDPKISGSDAEEDQRKLGEVILTAIGQSGIKTRDVVVGIPSSKTFATIVDLPKMSPQELKTNIQYEAEQYIPSKIDEVKIDYALLGDSPVNPEKSEVLITSVANEYSEPRLDMIENLGLNVLTLEPDSIALVRAVLPANSTNGLLIVEMGDTSSDIVVVKDGAPRLVRAIPIGFQSLVKTAVQNLNIDQNQAQQFILKFGLAPDRLEGKVVRSIDGILDQFSSEINKSVNFFQGRYANTPVSSVLLSGYCTAIPLFSEYINGKISIQSQLANPWQKVQLSAADKDKLSPISSQFGVVLGLAQRTTFV
jgi:type IV pilus assembly protein PilM